MHVLVSWDVRKAGKDWKELDKEMRGALEGFSWVRPLRSLYLVRLKNRVEWTEIRDYLQEVAEEAEKENSGDVRFLISPIIGSSRYDGYLPIDVWDKVNARTD